MLGGSYKVATVWGIPIRIHVSLLIMVVFMASSFGWVAGILLEAGLALSIILHELGHSLVAIQKGCRVRQITLMFIGGAAQMDRLPRRPMDEFLVAIAGPAVSFALAAGLYQLAPRVPLPDLGIMNGRPFNGVGFLAYVNLSLGLFNLLPSFPMDGGRILRAAITPKLGRLRATFYASRIGQMMAVIFGFYGFLQEPKQWFLIAIAFFIYTAASSEYRQVLYVEQMRNNPFGGWPFGVRQPEPPPIPEDEVIIGPSPYQGGRRQRTVIRPEDDDTTG